MKSIKRKSRAKTQKLDEVGRSSGPSCRRRRSAMPSELFKSFDKPENGLLDASITR